MLSERRAWLKLAKLWSKAKKNSFGDYSVVINPYSDDNPGLCACLIDLMTMGFISSETATEMEIKIRSFNPTNPQVLEWVRNYGAMSTYKWPTNKKGARSRVVFCLKQAKLLEKANVK